MPRKYFRNKVAVIFPRSKIELAVNKKTEHIKMRRMKKFIKILKRKLSVTSETRFSYIFIKNTFGDGVYLLRHVSSNIFTNICHFIRILYSWQHCCDNLLCFMFAARLTSFVEVIFYLTHEQCRSETEKKLDDVLVQHCRSLKNITLMKTWN